MAFTQALPVLDASHAAEHRRRIAAMARHLGFDETKEGKVAIAVTEIATNLTKHAGEGEILVRPLTHGSHDGIELLGIDRGKGIADIHKAMQDGFSTAGSPGTGLGAISRLADEFDIYSSSGGTIVMARFWARDVPHPGPFEIEGLAVPKPGEDVCGDDWGCHLTEDTLTIMVADGLGHGAAAAAASREARLTFLAEYGTPPAQALSDIHGALRSTRGAAAAVVKIDRSSGRATFAGVGNIAATITGEKVHRMVSHNGIVGHELRRVQEFLYPWTPESLIVMASDGLMTQWTLDPYPGLLSHHLSIAAAILYRDFSRGRDDTTVVIAREGR
jgi:anti-sigma regulatory factor (Ser/Thr protein kinase)